MRTCAYRTNTTHPDHGSRRPVACGDVTKTRENTPRVQVSKQHGCPIATWGIDPALAERPGDDGLAARKITFYSSKAASLEPSFVPANVAHVQALGEFAKQGASVIPMEYQKLFALTDDETKEVYSHMRAYGIIRQCCALQASARLKKTQTDAPDYDLPRCDEYNLQVVENNFLKTRLSMDYAGDVYSSYGNVEPPIVQGLCEMHSAFISKSPNREDLKSAYCAKAETAYLKHSGLPAGLEKSAYPRWYNEFCRRGDSAGSRALDHAGP